MEPVLLRYLDIEKTASLLDLEFCQLKHFCVLLMILQNEYNVLIIGKKREASWIPDKPPVMNRFIQIKIKSFNQYNVFYLPYIVYLVMKLFHLELEI